jgi:hypothetical protein
MKEPPSSARVVPVLSLVRGPGCSKLVAWHEQKCVDTIVDMMEKLAAVPLAHADASRVRTGLDNSFKLLGLLNGQFSGRLGDICAC